MTRRFSGGAGGAAGAHVEGRRCGIVGGGGSEGLRGMQVLKGWWSGFGRYGTLVRDEDQ